MTEASSVIGARLSDPWETGQVVVLPPGWANIYRDEIGKLTVEPCPCLMIQFSERRRRLVYGSEIDGEIVAANDRPGYVTSTADWAIMLARRNGATYGR